MFIKLILPVIFCLGICQAEEIEPRKYGNPGRPRPPYGSASGYYPPQPNRPTQATTAAQLLPNPTATTAPPVVSTTTESSIADSDDIPPPILAFFINDKRRRHGCPPITIDPILTAKAKKCANYYQATKEVTENNNTNLPENLCDEPPTDSVDIFGVGGEGGGGLIALIDTWYKQLTIPQPPATEVYNYKKPDLKNIAGYTQALQLIWKETTKCGCASSNKPIAAKPKEEGSKGGADGGAGNTAGTAGSAGSGNTAGGTPNRKRRSLEPELMSEEEEEASPGLAYRADPSTTEAATADQHVHVCVCDASPNGRQPNYIKNVPAPR